jgi:hypothetical protein
MEVPDLLFILDTRFGDCWRRMFADQSIVEELSLEAAKSIRLKIFLACQCRGEKFRHHERWPRRRLGKQSSITVELDIKGEREYVEMKICSPQSTC